MFRQPPALNTSYLYYNTAAGCIYFLDLEAMCTEINI